MPGQNNSQPPVAWRYSGNQMKRWRTKSNVSREQLAAASNYSPDTIKSVTPPRRSRRGGVTVTATALVLAGGVTA